MPKIIAFIQARMSSHRLPGKVLMSINGKTLIQCLYGQVALVREIDRIVVLTSTEQSDDPIVAMAEINNIPYFRGSLNNVALRFHDALINYNPEYFIRLNADSPLYHREIISKGIELQQKTNAKFITNVLPRTYPTGMGFELIDTGLFMEQYSNFNAHEDLEHVTKYFYRHADQFKIVNLKNSEDLSSMHFAVDTQDDFLRVQKVFASMSRPYLEYSWSDYINLFKTTGIS